MAIEVFNRYEKKYILHSEVYKQFQEELKQYMELDPHNQNGALYTISNLYFDTPNNQLIRHSLGKPFYKEKLRMRSYGIPKEDSMVFLEIKKKVNRLVNKRRTKLKLEEAYAFAKTGIPPALKSYMNPQVIQEINYFLSLYQVAPLLYLAYDRLAFFGADQPDLRISFDTNIRTRRHDLKLEAGDHGESLLPEYTWLMEIKAEKTIPLWLSALLSRYSIFSTRFSKYGKEYENKLRKENLSCSTFYLPHQEMQPSHQQLLYQRS